MYHQEVKSIELIQCLIIFSETSQGRPNCVLKWRLHSDVLRMSPRTSILNILVLQYFPSYWLTDPICSVKYLKVSCCLVLKFWGNVLRMFSKLSEKTSVGWRPWDVPKASIFNLSYKCIFIAFYSVIVLVGTSDQN